MEIGSRRYTLRFEPAHYAQVEQLAHKLGVSPADVVRRAVEQYLLGQKLIQDSQLRLLRVSEYTQIAVDAIIREDHPELRETLVIETDKRMERFHGAR